MSITPATPVPRAPVARWEIDGFSARIDARTVTLLYYGYDAAGVKIAEKRYDLTDATTPTFGQFVVACPAAATLKRQIEQYGATLHPDLSGAVD